MTISYPVQSQKRLADEVEFRTDNVLSPSYGRYLEDYTIGDVFEHPRGYTFDRSFARSFAMTFMQANPLYSNVEYAKAFGFEDMPVSPQLLFNIVLSLGVQNDSEKAIANLGYYNARFLRPVYPGDTIRSLTKVIGKKDNGEDKPGIAHVKTIGVNQHSKTVLQYERKIMLSHRKSNPETRKNPTRDIPFAWSNEPMVHLPQPSGELPNELTGAYSYAQDFEPGQIVIHANGRTVTDEHVRWTNEVGNTHPLHYDRLYSTGLSGAMSGEPIVYGGLVFSWLEGIASRDVTENAIWDLGFTEGYHTQPTVSGDTITAITRILAKEEFPGGWSAEIITMQLIGLKNIKAADALDRHGEDLFIREHSKKKIGKDKISSKIFEIERQLLIRKKP